LPQPGLALAIGLALTLGLACGPPPLVPEAVAPPVISVDPGLDPVMTPEQVAGIVIAHIHNNEQVAGRVVAPARIVRMTVTTPGGVSRVEPNAGQPGVAAPDIVWVVRAFGTFTTRRGLRENGPKIAGSGFYVIADGNGSIMGFGFP
jgi:hypothetical protein